MSAWAIDKKNRICVISECTTPTRLSDISLECNRIRENDMSQKSSGEVARCYETTIFTMVPPLALLSAFKRFPRRQYVKQR